MKAETELTDESPLSHHLRTGSAQNHHDAERRPFMRVFFRSELSNEAYVSWLQRQFLVYEALEEVTEQLRDHPVLGVMYTPELLRLPGLSRDLAFWMGPDWRDRLTASPVAEKYAARIREVAETQPELWVAHQWLRYLGMVGGQEILRKIIVKSQGAVDRGGDDGLDFYRFPDVGEVGPFFGRFHARMDGLVLTPEVRDLVVEEANIGFQLNMDLTDELAVDFGIMEPEGSAEADIAALKDESA